MGYVANTLPYFAYTHRCKQNTLVCYQNTPWAATYLSCNTPRAFFFNSAHNEPCVCIWRGGPSHGSWKKPTENHSHITLQKTHTVPFCALNSPVQHLVMLSCLAVNEHSTGICQKNSPNTNTEKFRLQSLCAH